jgi:3-hydroxybutyryl-CoA dehydrogenase
MSSAIQSICVCGAGTRGVGITQLIAQSGFHTILYDVNRAVIEEAETTISNILQSEVDTNKISVSEKNNTLSRLRFTTDMNDCIADFFIEAIVKTLQ